MNKKPEDWQRETAERILVDLFGVRGEMKDVTLWDNVMLSVVEAMQAQQAEDTDQWAAEGQELARKLAEAERQRDEANRAFRKHDVLVVQLQVLAEKAVRQRAEALAKLEKVSWSNAWEENDNDATQKKLDKALALQDQRETDRIELPMTKADWDARAWASLSERAHKSERQLKEAERQLKEAERQRDEALALLQETDIVRFPVELRPRVAAAIGGRAGLGGAHTKESA